MLQWERHHLFVFPKGIKKPIKNVNYLDVGENIINCLKRGKNNRDNVPFPRWKII